MPNKVRKLSEYNRYNKMWMYMYTAEWNTVSQYCTKIKPCKDPAYNNNNSINWIKVKPRHARYAMSFPTVNAYFSCLSKYATWRNASWRNTNNDRAWQVRQTDETCSGGCRDTTPLSSFFFPDKLHVSFLQIKGF